MAFRLHKWLSFVPLVYLALWISLAIHAGIRLGRSHFNYQDTIPGTAYDFHDAFVAWSTQLVLVASVLWMCLTAFLLFTQYRRATLKGVAVFAAPIVVGVAWFYWDPFGFVGWWLD